MIFSKNNAEQAAVQSKYLLQAAERTIMNDLREVMADRITDRILEDLRSEVSEIVRTEVSKYTMDCLESYRDHRSFSEHVIAYIKYSDEEDKVDE